MKTGRTASNQGCRFLGLESHGPAERKVGLKDFTGLAERTLVTHEAMRGRRSRAEVRASRYAFSAVSTPMARG